MAVAASVVVHAALFGAVLLAVPKSETTSNVPSTEVAFIDLPRPEARRPAEPKPPRPLSPKPPGATPDKAVARTPVPQPPPRQSLTRAVVARLDTPSVSPTRAAGPSAELSDAELAGASTTGGGGEGGGGGGGGGGGACNMLARLQAGLRKDQLVQLAAHAGASGRAVRVWNGDWVQGSGEDGRGMAAVREAILWEVGFAPKECRDQRVHGLVLVSLNDAPGAPRIAMGGGDWRWSDLLVLRPSAR